MNKFNLTHFINIFFLSILGNLFFCIWWVPTSIFKSKIKWCKSIGYHFRVLQDGLIKCIYSYYFNLKIVKLFLILLITISYIYYFLITGTGFWGWGWISLNFDLFFPNFFVIYSIRWSFLLSSNSFAFELKKKKKKKWSTAVGNLKLSYLKL